MTAFEVQMFAPPEFADFVTSSAHFFYGGVWADENDDDSWELYIPIEDVTITEFHEDMYISLYRETVDFKMRGYGSEVFFHCKYTVIDRQRYAISKKFNDLHVAMSFALDRYKAVQKYGLIRHKPGSKLHIISGSNYEPLALDNHQLKDKGESSWHTLPVPGLTSF